MCVCVCAGQVCTMQEKEKGRIRKDGIESWRNVLPIKVKPEGRVRPLVADCFKTINTQTLVKLFCFFFFKKTNKKPIRMFL